MRRAWLFVRQSSAGWLAAFIWVKTPPWVQVRWRLLVGLVGVALLTTALYLFHRPWPTRLGDPWDEAMVGFMAAIFTVYVLLMILFRDDWPWSAVGIYYVMVGEVSLWGLFAFLQRMGWATETTNLWGSMLLRSGFVVGGAILAIEASLWARDRIGSGRSALFVRRRWARWRGRPLPPPLVTHRRPDPDALLAALAGSLPTIFADATGTILAVSPPAVALIGQPAADIEGRNLMTLMPTRYRAQHLAGLTRYLETGESRIIGRVVRVDLLCHDGTEIPVHLALATTLVGDQRYFVGNIWRRDEEVVP